MDNINNLMGYLYTTASPTGIVPTDGISNQNPASPVDSQMDEGLSSQDKVRKIAESYLTVPEEILSTTSIPDLEKAVEQCKALYSEKSGASEDTSSIVRQLIELKKILFLVKEAIKEETVTSDSPKQEDVLNKKLKEQRIILGHHFQLQNHPKSLATNYCDRCSGVIWNAMHVWHLCIDCDYKCHGYCLKLVGRICAHVLVTEEPNYIEKICPEPPNGLASQKYRCAECLKHTSFSEAVLEPRRCDYNGKFYCPTCHWNSTAVIPARIVSNWDFTERRVCRVSKQILRLLSKMPLLRLEELNPALFAFVDDLKAVKTLRRRLLQMKKYLTACKIAVETNVMWQIKDRHHFLLDSDRYSLQDLIDLRDGTLLPELHRLLEVFHKHITQDCQICCGQGFICELCNVNPKVVHPAIFPFEMDVQCCSVCGTAFHLPCWVNNLQKCPKCVRRQSRVTINDP